MKLRIFCLTAIIATGLSACEPTMFGMPQSQFQSLTKSQQDQVIAAYNQRQQTIAQNQPYEDAINAIVPAIKASKHQHHDDFPPPPPSLIQPPAMTMPAPPSPSPFGTA